MYQVCWNFANYDIVGIQVSITLFEMLFSSLKYSISYNFKKSSEFSSNKSCHGE